MMIRKAEFPYYEDEEVQVVSLPLKDTTMQMLLIQSKQAIGLSKLENKLTGEKLFNYINALDSSNEITVCLLFSFTYLLLENIQFFRIDRLRNFPLKFSAFQIFKPFE